MEDETEIIEAVRAAIAAEWTDIPVLVKAAPPTWNGEVPASGFTAGSELPCFIVSAMDAEKVDETASFELVSLGLPVVVSYCKSAAPKNWSDDADVRRKRLQLEDLLYVNTLSGMPSGVFNGAFQALGVYQPGGEKGVVVSAVLVVYTFTRARPGVS